MFPLCDREGAGPVRASWLITLVSLAVGLYLLAHIASWAVRVADEAGGALS